MESKIKNIIESMFGHMFSPKCMDSAVKQILAISPWEKFFDKKPDIGSKVIVRFEGGLTIHRSLTISDYRYYLKLSEAEWMYVPD